MTDTQDDADQADLHFVPFPPIETLAVVGDRRCAATIAADGSVCWLCLPRFDAIPVFGALLDLTKGGYWRMGPETRDLGVQRYLPGTAVLTTIWTHPDGVLEATDCMLWPQDRREPGLDSRRVMLRRLRCTSGRRRVLHRIVPREDFRIPATVSAEHGYLRLQTRALDLSLWCSHSIAIFDDAADGAQAVHDLASGEEIWTVLDEAAHGADWSVAAASKALEATAAWWRDWSGTLACSGARAERMRLSAIVVQLCTYAPTGAVIAAPTSSLPERVPGKYNYDYRYAWVRDSSLSVAVLAQLGVTGPAGRLLDFFAGRLAPQSDDKTQMPLQVLYRIDGGKRVPKQERPDINGYRDCAPVMFGNPVWQMHEIDGFGFLVDCAHTFATHGGTLSAEHWKLLHRVVDFIAHNWQEPDAGTWELMPSQQFVSTKVLCWVALDRGIAIARLLHHTPPAIWSTARRELHAQVMSKGWSAKIGAFRQRYDSDTLDGTALLIPLLGFLPPDHPYVRATVEQVEKVLSINGLVHRFVPERTPGRPNHAMGDKEGAFLMCTMWLAQAWQMLGEPKRAEAALSRAEACTGSSLLFSEAADARKTPGLLGNMPLLFTHVAYTYAARAVAAA
jgi:GH15 family glucan-1,4-alpha-glucosidase